MIERPRTTSRQYEPMVCACGRTIAPEPPYVEKVWSATSYATCVYQCVCGRGYSNAASEAGRTCITETPERNVPNEVSGGLNEVLGKALNVRNRTAKRDKFCFSSSEDAVTWTIFRWLEDSHALALVPAAAGLAEPSGEAEILLWGAPSRSGRPRAEALRGELIAVADELGEDPDRRSEPDVIISWPGLLLFVEVKYQAPNDVKPDYGNFVRYTDRAELFAVTPEAVATSGYYELVRNWRLGVGLAERLGSPFALVNLGPRRLAARTPDLAGTFSTTPARTFGSLSWEALLTTAAQLEQQQWLDDFIHARQLDSRWA